MGDRYTFWKNCPNCGVKMECWYAPSCGAYDEKCPECGKEYFIEMEFVLVEKTPENIKQHEEMLKAEEEAHEEFEEYTENFRTEKELEEEHEEQKEYEKLCEKENEDKG